MIKKNLKTIGVCIIPIMYILFFLAIKILPFLEFTIDLLLFATIAIIFVSLHFFLDIKKMYEWLFKYRYLVGIAIFAFLVIGGYHGSNITFWNRYISGEENIKYTKPVLGIARGIRSDEWMVTTLNNLSQANDSVDFSSVNQLINAKDSKISFYPRLITKDWSMLLFPHTWGFMFLPLENAFSFYWYFELFVTFFVVLELLMIITKKNKLYSTLGAFLLTISPTGLWWDGWNCLVCGSAALLVIYHFMQTKSIKLRILLSLLLGYIATKYVMLLYPAWMIPYAYLFMMIFIWMIIENKNKLKLKDSLYLIFTLIIFLVTLLPLVNGSKDVMELVSNTVYPAGRLWYGGSNLKLLFGYMSNMYFPYIDVGNPCEFSQFLSLFPIPLIMSIYYLLKNKKEGKKVDWFLLLISGFQLVLFIMCAIPLPKFINTLTLMTMSVGERAQLVIGAASIFNLIYLMSRYEKKKDISLKKEDNKKILLGSIIFTAFAGILSLSYLSIDSNLLKVLMFTVSFMIFVPIFYYLIINSKKGNLVLFILLMFVTFVGCILIDTISKGLNIIYETPLAKEIQEIVKEDENAVFITVDNIFSNYILANGGAVINSTNYVPNLELWHSLDKDKKYEQVYNRYAHVHFNLTDQDTSFELLTTDSMMVNLNYDKICELDINYIVSGTELEIKEKYYNQIYNENDVYIYKTTCEN